MYTYPMEILRLDQEVAPQLSDYTGQRLSEKVLGFLTKVTTSKHTFRSQRKEHEISKHLLLNNFLFPNRHL